MRHYRLLKSFLCVLCPLLSPWPSSSSSWILGTAPFLPCLTDTGQLVLSGALTVCLRLAVTSLSFENSAWTTVLKVSYNDIQEKFTLGKNYIIYPRQGYKGISTPTVLKNKRNQWILYLHIQVICLMEYNEISR